MSRAIEAPPSQRNGTCVIESMGRATIVAIEIHYLLGRRDTRQAVGL
jgi:hypothetical protein